MDKTFCDMEDCDGDGAGNVTYYDDESNELANDDVCIKHISALAIAKHLRNLGYELNGRKIVELCINFDTIQYFKDMKP